MFPLLTRAVSRTRKGAFFLFSIFLLLAGEAPVVRGQSALDGFDPNVDGLVIRVVVVQPDGKILSRRRFQRAASGTTVTRNHCPAEPGRHARHALSTQTRTMKSVRSRCRRTARFWSGGDFTNIGGQTRNGIARLDARPARLMPLQPERELAHVYSIAVQADGKILAGGAFTSIGGQARNCIARLDATTGLADSFNPNANSGVFSIAVQADGKILSGRRFHQHRRTDAQLHRPARCHDRLG